MSANSRSIKPKWSMTLRLLKKCMMHILKRKPNTMAMTIVQVIAMHTPTTIVQVIAMDTPTPTTMATATVTTMVTTMVMVTATATITVLTMTTKKNNPVLYKKTKTKIQIKNKMW